jgi:hypothetical protein
MQPHGARYWLNTLNAIGVVQKQQKPITSLMPWQLHAFDGSVGFMMNRVNCCSDRVFID